MDDLIKLYENPKTVVKQEKLLSFLNQNPPAAWVKKHPFISNYKYLPIDKVEFLLKAIYREYDIEVLKTGMLLNAIEVTVRIKILDPATKAWRTYDGVGACELQTQSKTGPLKLDMSNINSGAVAMALPIAKSVALKDACDHLGNIFGANLNRKDTIELNLSTAPDPLDERMTALITAATSIQELEALKEHLKPHLQTLFDEKWNLLSGAAQ